MASLAQGCLSVAAVEVLTDMWEARSCVGRPGKLRHGGQTTMTHTRTYGSGFLPLYYASVTHRQEALSMHHAHEELPGDHVVHYMPG